MNPVQHLARRLPLVPIGALCALLALGACESAGGPPLSDMASIVNATLEPAAVVLAVGDKLSVRFPYSPTWNQESEIAGDGSASFMAVGRLIVAGMSLGQLKDTLGQSYGHVFQDHELDVVLSARGARKVFVMGEVKTPGSLELDPDRRLTLLEALARAGGPLKQSAYLAHTYLSRWSSSTGKQLHWTIDAREKNWNGSEPLYLQAYDVVFVPNTPIDEVGIWVDNYIRRLIPFPYIIPPMY
jgi:protein involved in polysaccharide export with SLBB domain